jgi:four helix bundle protein
MRDHRKLRAFELSDQLAIATYRATVDFPAQERYGLCSQMRRAAVSVPSNIVEGCARNSQADYLHFLNISYGSARELEYQISLAAKLGFFDEQSAKELDALCCETAKVLNGLIKSIRNA